LRKLPKKLTLFAPKGDVAEVEDERDAEEEEDEEEEEDAVAVVEEVVPVEVEVVHEVAHVHAHPVMVLPAEIIEVITAALRMSNQILHREVELVRP